MSTHAQENNLYGDVNFILVWLKLTGGTTSERMPKLQMALL